MRPVSQFTPLSMLFMCMTYYEPSLYIIRDSFIHIYIYIYTVYYCLCEVAPLRGFVAACTPEAVPEADWDYEWRII